MMAIRSAEQMRVLAVLAIHLPKQNPNVAASK